MLPLVATASVFAKLWWSLNSKLGVDTVAESFRRRLHHANDMPNANEEAGGRVRPLLRARCDSVAGFGSSGGLGRLAHPFHGRIREVRRLTAPVHGEVSR